MLRTLCGMMVVGACCTLAGCGAHPAEKPDDSDIIGTWERKESEAGEDPIVWRLKFSNGGTWQQDGESVGETEAAATKGTWKTYPTDKSIKKGESATIVPDFQLEMEYWLESEAPIPVGATIVERSPTDDSVLVRETWNVSLRTDKDSGPDTLKLFRFDKPQPPQQFNVTTEEYTRVE